MWMLHLGYVSGILTSDRKREEYNSNNIITYHNIGNMLWCYWLFLCYRTGHISKNEKRKSKQLKIKQLQKVSEHWCSPLVPQDGSAIMGNNWYLFRKMRHERSTLKKLAILAEEHNNDKMNGSKYAIEKVLKQQGKASSWEDCDTIPIQAVGRLGKSRWSRGSSPFRWN